MASTALISTASAAVATKRAVSGPLSVGLGGPRHVSFLSVASGKKPSSRPDLLVVKAQQQQGSSGQYSAVVQVPSTGAPVHTPWTATEDEYEVRMRFDMPGMASEDIDVKVEGDMLVIKDLGRQIYSPYDTKLQLPPYCLKHDMKATLKNGVLHISVPKTSYVSVKPAPIFKDQAGAQAAGTSKVNVRVPNQVQDLSNSPRNVRAPWSHIEEEDQVRVSLDMPGLWPEDVEVDIINDLLIINGSERNVVDKFGRKILSYDVKLQLPNNCVKDRVNAVFKNGVLYVTVPKMVRPINVQVRPS